MIVVAPASAPRDVHLYQQGIDRLREVYEVDVRFAPEQCANSHGYLAATDDQRAQQLNDALRDESARAIIAARGGFGCTRLLGEVDTDAAARHPKWIIGYSDLTALQWLLYKETGLVSASGPVVTEFAHFAPGFADTSGEVTMQTLNGPLARMLDDDPTRAWSAFLPVVSGPAEVDTSEPRADSICLAGGETLRAVRTGGAVVTGPLLAGPLSVIAALAGTPYMPDLSGTVLVLEDTGEAPYRVDRMLTQLRQGGYLDDLAAVVLGSFREGDVKKPTLSMDTVLHDAFAPFEYPVLAGLPYGHLLPRLTLPIGAPATVNPRADHLSLSVALRSENDHSGNRHSENRHSENRHSENRHSENRHSENRKPGV